MSTPLPKSQPSTLPPTMNSIQVQNKLATLVPSTPLPKIQPNDVIIKIHYSGLNRLDTIQRMGMPPPPGADNIMGLEVSGVIVSHGSNVPVNTIENDLKLGSRVMALVVSGGHAEFVSVNYELVIPLTKSMSMRDAGGICENWQTAYMLLNIIGNCSKNSKGECIRESFYTTDSVVIHAGGSGVGLALIQLCKSIGIMNVITTSSQGKIGSCKDAGADNAIDRGLDNGLFSAAVLAVNNGKPVDLILDCVGGGAYAEENMKMINLDGSWVLYGLLGGPSAESFNKMLLGSMLGKRINFRGTTLRGRSEEYKIELARRFKEEVVPLFGIGKEQGGLEVKFAKVFKLEDIQKGHDLMDSNGNDGKIIIELCGGEGL